MSVITRSKTLPIFFTYSIALHLSVVLRTVGDRRIGDLSLNNLRDTYVRLLSGDRLCRYHKQVST